MVRSGTHISTPIFITKYDARNILLKNVQNMRKYAKGISQAKITECTDKFICHLIQDKMHFNFDLKTTIDL
jgi:hypothetical protein